MNLTARTFAYAFGAIYVAVGLIGFALTGFSDFASPNGHILVVFEINPLHNLVHVAIGAAFLAAARAGEFASRRTVALIAATYAVVGVVGLFLAGDNPLNILALNHADNVLHLVTAGAGALVLSQSRQPATA